MKRLVISMTLMLLREIVRNSNDMSQIACETQDICILNTIQYMNLF